MGVDRTGVGGPLGRTCGSSWTFEMLEEVEVFRGIWKIMETSTEYIRGSCD